MDFPVWDIDVGYGPLMAWVAVVHVFVAHFAVGGGLSLVVLERRARRTGDLALLAHVRRLSAFFAPTTLVVGALTGVGIWFVIGLLSPTATGVLIRTFVWGWAIEWTFFLVEILAAILYAKGWDRLAPRTHEALGWVYFVAAWASLAVINGIVTFMLTPGAWLETGALVDGFFNPTYLPSLVMRTAICLLLAGLFGALIAARTPDAKDRARLVRTDAVVALVGLAAAWAAQRWYGAAVPAELAATIGARLTIPARALEAFHALSLALGAALVVVALVPRTGRTAVAAVLLALGLGWFGAFEWWREGARKPYVLANVVYGNGIGVAEVATLARDGALPAIRVPTGDPGRDLFLHQCRACHTLSGYNPVLPAFAGTDATFVEGVLGGLHKMRAPMPPFAGTAAERATLAAWLAARADRTPLAARARRDGRDLGALVYEVRCGVCHVEGGFGDKGRSFEGLSADDAKDLLASVSFDEMPLFSGTDEERDALVAHLLARAEGGAR